MLAGISPQYGMYAVLGNHEYYAGLQNSLDFLRRAGFRVLRKEQAKIAECLTIAGVDDPTGARWGDAGGSDEKGLLASPIQHRFTILLKHRPAVHPESRGRFDLQLSGHVHKGQIFPFNLLTWFFFPVSAGLNQLDDGSRLYVSRGTGTWGPPIRFLAPPEITVIDLMPVAPL
jgi:predicted MPP superfamily phosphohydrolase